MNPEVLAAMQRALDAQFQAGKAVGALEALINQIPKPIIETPEKP